MDQVFKPDDLHAGAAMAWTWGVAFLPRLLTSLIVLAIGITLARLAGRFVTGAVGSVAHIDRTVRPVLGAVTRYAILVLTIIAALGQIGVQTASLLAVLGAAGLAVGLALQGTLTNIAAGIMLLWLRPFRAGDYIELVSGSVAGTIDEVGLFACRLTSFDGVAIFSPNSTLWNVALRNHSQSRIRLIAYQVSLPSGTDTAAASEALTATAREQDGFRNEPPPSVAINKTDDSSLVLLCRFWVDPNRVGAAQRNWPDAARARIETALKPGGPIGITRIVPSNSDPSEMLGAN